MTDHSHRIVAAARSWLGTPYVHQASCKGAGCDCLGLIRGVWREVIGEEPEATPPYAPDWTATGGGEQLLKAAMRHLVRKPQGAPIEPGDVLLFRYRAHLPARHAAIATGPDTMIHAQEHAGVVEVPLSGWWWRHLAAVFAFPPMDEVR